MLYEVITIVGRVRILWNDLIEIGSCPVPRIFAWHHRWIFEIILRHEAEHLADIGDGILSYNFV